MVFSAVIVAGGSGERFGRKKQFLDLLGIPIIKRTVSCFDRHPAVERIVVVVPEADIPEARRILNGVSKELVVTNGGQKRQESVMNGLRCAHDSQAVLIHDGVRPFITQDLIDRVTGGLKGVDGCIPALEVTDTLKEVRQGMVVRTIPRKGLFQVQTPQAFVAHTLINAHENAAEGAVFTDDSSLLEAHGKTVRIVEGDPYNMKITFREDMMLAEAILKCRTGSA